MDCIVRGVAKSRTRLSDFHFQCIPCNISDTHSTVTHLGLPWWLRQLRICLKYGRPGFDPWIGKIPWRRAWQLRGNPLQYSCLENPHGQRSLAGYSPWGHKESDTTERLTFSLHFTLGTNTFRNPAPSRDNKPYLSATLDCHILSRCGF